MIRTQAHFYKSSYGSSDSIQICQKPNAESIIICVLKFSPSSLLQLKLVFAAAEYCDTLWCLCGIQTNLTEHRLGMLIQSFSTSVMLTSKQSNMCSVRAQCLRIINLVQVNLPNCLTLTLTRKICELGNSVKFNHAYIYNAPHTHPIPMPMPMLRWESINESGLIAKRIGIYIVVQITIHSETFQFITITIWNVYLLAGCARF